MSNEKKPIHLVLGSGGARGLAHIGAIEVLEEQGYEIRAITGCSMGALIGGLYAAGKLAAYTDWIMQLSKWDVLRFLDITLSARNGMFKGDKIMDKIQQLVGQIDIQSLPMPYTAVAADIKTGKEVWIAQGDLINAIRASISVPGMFTPLIKNNMILVDGGILNPLPVPPILLGNDMLSVAISVSGRAVKHPLGQTENSPSAVQPVTNHAPTQTRIDDFLTGLQGMFGWQKAGSSTVLAPTQPNFTDVMMGMFNTMQDTIARHKLASNPPDILIEIPNNICQSHEFNQASKLIPAGRYWTSQALKMQLDAQ